MQLRTYQQQYEQLRTAFERERAKMESSAGGRKRERELMAQVGRGGVGSGRAAPQLGATTIYAAGQPGAVALMTGRAARPPRGRWQLVEVQRLVEGQASGSVQP